MFFNACTAYIFCKCQGKVEVLIVGTQHQFSDSLLLRQNFQEINSALVKFSPEIICIESIPVSDAASLREVRKEQLGVAEKLRNEKGIEQLYLSVRIGELLVSLKRDPANQVLRSKLANHLYANHDFWNAYYQYYLLDRDLSENGILQNGSALLESFALDSIHARVTKRGERGEYNNIVYPVANKLNIQLLENIDYRADEDEFLKRVKRAAIGTVFSLKFFKLKKLMKQMNAEMLEAERAGKLMDHINSQEQQEFYLDLIDNAHRFKKSKNMRKPWSCGSSEIG